MLLCKRSQWDGLWKVGIHCIDAAIHKELDGENDSGQDFNTNEIPSTLARGKGNMEGVVKGKVNDY